jgi:hypothetical protein
MSLKYPGGFIMKNPTAPTTSAAKGVWTLDQVTGYVKQGIWPATPGTPTIGTATAVTYQTATVAFTAPTNLGSGTVTYTATSNPGGLTGTGASSPVTVSGLSGSTSYTFTVTAATPGGTSAASAASNSITTPVAPPTVIGEAYGGGYYAGLISTAGNGIADFYLIVGPVASAQNNSKQFKTSNTGSDPTSVIDGPTNSATMNSGTYPAAQFCEGLTIGGYSDWYMPAKNELEICYYSFRPTVNSNNTSSGTNTNAVPSRPSNYTSGDPAQTALSLFIEGGSEAFTSSGIRYCSSTQQSSTSAWLQQFSNGSQTSFDKDGSYIVRAVRRIAV